MHTFLCNVMPHNVKPRHRQNTSTLSFTRAFPSDCAHRDSPQSRKNICFSIVDEVKPAQGNE